MKKIALKGIGGIGKFALVDDDDFDRLSKFNWYLVQGYATSSGSNKMLMHRVVNNTPSGFVTDHINLDKLDNRKENLRTCTHSQNLMNRCETKNKSLPKGVYLSSNKPGKNKKQKFKANIRVNLKQIYLGVFNTVEEAQSAYNIAALKYHGEYARLNSF